MVLNGALHGIEVDGRRGREIAVLRIEAGEHILHLVIAVGAAVARGKEARQVCELGHAHADQAVVDRAGQMRERDGKHLDADNERCRLEIRVDEDILLVEHDAGVVRGGVDLDAQELLDVVQRILDRARDDKAAAESQRVLQRVLGTVVAVKVAALKILAAAGGAADLAGQAAQLVHVLAHRLDVAVEAFIIEAEDAVGHLDEILDLVNKDGRGALALAVGEHDGVRVLELEMQGLEALLLHGFLGAHDLALVVDVLLADEGKADVGDGGDVCLADGAAARDARRDAVVQEVAVAVCKVIRCAGSADEHVVEADDHHRAHFLVRVERRKAEGMGAQHHAVLRLHEVLVDGDVLVLADAAVEAVNGLATLGELLHDLAALGEARVGIGCDLDLAAVVSDVIDVLQGQVVAVQNQSVHTACPFVIFIQSLCLSIVTAASSSLALISI